MASDKKAQRNVSQVCQIPKLSGNYVNVYSPQGDHYYGPSKDTIKNGEYYEDWIPNDHTFIQAKDGSWHAFGITGPCSGAGKFHEAEYQSFHIRSPFQELGRSLQENTWIEEPKILRPADRPQEDVRLYAPCVIEKNSLYYLFYGPEQIRSAVSSNLYHWTAKGTVFTCHPDHFEGDPMIIKISDLYYMYLLHSPAGICCRTSADLINWSEKISAYEHSAKRINCESPFIVKKNEGFYLFWTPWPWSNGKAYEHETRVLFSKDPLCFKPEQEIACLDAHAPEVLKDKDGNWFISSAEWPERGINMARLEWV